MQKWSKYNKISNYLFHFNLNKVDFLFWVLENRSSQTQCTTNEIAQ